MSGFSEALAHVAGEDPHENIAKIKELVVGQMRSTDSRVRIQVTDHFNHSFVPDLVLSWADAPDTRNVFLRTSFDVSDLLQDLDVLSNERPIILPLSPVPQTDAVAKSSLPEMAATSQTLITDPYGLEAFEDESEGAPVVSLLSHAILQGGRGIIGAQRAHVASEVLSEGFEGAQAADHAKTSEAVETAETLLDGHRASQLNRLLHAVWVGSGASGAAFPSGLGVTSTLDAESLRFILDLPEFDDPTFWARLGASLTTERLCQLENFSATPNLQRILRGNVFSLVAKACRVFEIPGDETPKWSIVDKCLALQLRSTRALFSARSLSELPIPQEKPGISVLMLKRRAERASAKIGEIKVANDEVSLSYTAEGRDDITDDKALDGIDLLISKGLVVSALTRIRDDGSDLRCNFRTMTVAGNSSAKFYVSDLAETAIPLLASVTEPELSAVRELFQERSRGPEIPDDAAPARGDAALVSDATVVTPTD